MTKKGVSNTVKGVELRVKEAIMVFAGTTNKGVELLDIVGNN